MSKNRSTQKRCSSCCWWDEKENETPGYRSGFCRFEPFKLAYGYSALLNFGMTEGQDWCSRWVKADTL